MRKTGVNLIKYFSPSCMAAHSHLHLFKEAMYQDNEYIEYSDMK